MDGLAVKNENEANMLSTSPLIPDGYNTINNEYRTYFNANGTDDKRLTA